MAKHGYCQFGGTEVFRFNECHDGSYSIINFRFRSFEQMTKEQFERDAEILSSDSVLQARRFGAIPEGR